MSEKITISRDSSGKVVFSDPQPSQSDLVFWNNEDNETHYPVPFCTGLAVAPGATSPPYQYLPPNPSFPDVINYGCAMPGHEAESGTLTVEADSPPSGTMPVGDTPSTKTIGISRSDWSVTFEEVDVYQIDFVTWQNNDSETHWPVPGCTGLKVAPNASSNPMQPVPPLMPPPQATLAAPAGPPSLPLTLTYGCAIAGHEAEQGTINIYNTFLGPPTASPVVPVSIPLAKPYAPAILASGGKSPYTIEQDASIPYLTAVETAPAGTSAGVSVVLNAAPPAGTTSINYTLNATDALGTTINETIPITFSFNPLTPLSAATIFTKVKPYQPVPVATGGTSPYTMIPDSSIPYISLVETAPAGDSVGVSAILNSDPPASGPIAYILNITDAAGNSIKNQTITITLI